MFGDPQTEPVPPVASGVEQSPNPDPPADVVRAAAGDGADTPWRAAKRTAFPLDAIEID